MDVMKFKIQQKKSVWFKKKKWHIYNIVIYFMKKKFKEWQLTIPQISTKWTTTSFSLTHRTQKRGTKTYDIGNPGSGLKQAQKCGAFNEIPTLPSW